MGRKAHVVSLCAGLAILAVLPAFGCVVVVDTEALVDAWGEPLMLAFVSLLYADVNGHLPDSKEALQDFCRKQSFFCATMDWTRVSWQHREKDTLTIRYTNSQGITRPIIVTTHPISVNVGDKIMIKKQEEGLQGSAEE